MTDKQKRMLEGLALFARAAWESPIAERPDGPMDAFLHQLAGFVLDLHDDVRASAQPAQPSSEPAGEVTTALERLGRFQPIGVKGGGAMMEYAQDRGHWCRREDVLSVAKTIARATAAKDATIAELRRVLELTRMLLEGAKEGEQSWRECSEKVNLQRLEEKNAARQQHEADAARMRELEAQLETRKRMCHEKNEASVADGQTIRDLRTDLDAARSELETVKATVRDREAELRAANDMAAEDRAELERVKARLATVEMERNRFRSELAKVSSDNDEMSKDMEAMAKERDAHKAKLDRRTEMLCRMKEWAMRIAPIEAAAGPWYQAIHAELATDHEQTKPCECACHSPEGRASGMMHMVPCCDHAEHPAAPARPGDENHCTCGVPLLTPLEFGTRLCVHCDRAAKAEQPAAADGEGGT